MFPRRVGDDVTTALTVMMMVTDSSMVIVIVCVADDRAVRSIAAVTVVTILVTVIRGRVADGIVSTRLTATVVPVAGHVIAVMITTLHTIGTIVSIDMGGGSLII